MHLPTLPYHPEPRTQDLLLNASVTRSYHPIVCMTRVVLAAGLWMSGCHSNIARATGRDRLPNFSNPQLLVCECLSHTKGHQRMACNLL